MRKWLARILVFLAVGLQFSHQVIAHQHHDEIEMAADHHDDDHGDDHDPGHFPTHQIAHIFSPETVTTTLLKVPVQDITIEVGTLSIPKLNVIQENNCPYCHIRPPIPAYYKYFSLRAPPVC